MTTAYGALLTITLERRIRHLKCDEQKPSCLKCTTTGRVCDGYSTFYTAQSSGDQRGRAVWFVKPAPPGTLSVHLPGTDRERRSFDFFRVQTFAELEIALNTPSWNRLILQLSHSNSIVRHAAVALGSLGERFLIHDVLTPQNQEANACHDYGLLQYQKALQGLRENIHQNGEDTISLILISCFLFICFEFMQGNEIGALAHLHSGLNIVRGLQANSVKAGATRTGFASSQLSSTLEADIQRVYTVLDLQATLWLGSGEFQGKGDIQPPMDLLSLPNAQGFSDLDEAEWNLFGHIARLLASSCCSGSAKDTGDRKSRGTPETSNSAERAKLMRQFEQWPTALQQLLIRQRNELSVEHLQRATIMSINYKTHFVTQSSTMQPNDAILYLRFEHIFEDIVRLSTTLLEPVNAMANARLTHISRISDPSKDPMPVFHFAPGIIEALYLTAVRCRDWSISQRAITMLSTSPWREGAWDSAAMAKIAERKVKQLKAEGWYKTFDLCSRTQPPTVSGEGDVQQVT